MKMLCNQNIDLDFGMYLYINNKIMINDVKPYSRSLKHLLKENIGQSLRLTSLLVHPEQSPSKANISVFKLRNVKNNIERSLSGQIAPIKINQSYDLSNNINKTIYGNNKTQPSNQDPFLPIYQQKLIFQRQLRSKFQESLDNVLNQIIKKQKLPIKHSGGALPLPKNKYKNIRISTETQDSPTSNHKINRSYKNQGLLQPNTVNLLRIKQKIKQNLKKQKKVDQQCPFIPGRTNTRLDLSKVARNAKQVLAYYPLGQYRKQLISESPENIEECFMHLKHFRQDNAISKAFSLRKN